jgi:hypothetical protein
MICTFFHEVQWKEIPEVDFVGENPLIILYMCQSSAESCGIKTYTALLLCLNKIFFCIVTEVHNGIFVWTVQYMQEKLHKVH